MAERRAVVVSRLATSAILPAPGAVVPPRLHCVRSAHRHPFCPLTQPRERQSICSSSPVYRKLAKQAQFYAGRATHDQPRLRFILIRHLSDPIGSWPGKPSEGRDAVSSPRSRDLVLSRAYLVAVYAEAKPHRPGLIELESRSTLGAVGASYLLAPHARDRGLASRTAAGAEDVLDDAVADPPDE